MSLVTCSLVTVQLTCDTSKTCATSQDLTRFVKLLLLSHVLRDVIFILEGSGHLNRAPSFCRAHGTWSSSYYGISELLQELQHRILVLILKSHVYRNVGATVD